MVELVYHMPYHKTMKRSSLTNIIRESVSDFLDALDMREHSQPRRLQPGETIETAWQSTGTYLRKAMDQYGPVSPQTAPARSRR